jgi:restriction endonuclease S subunit
MDVMPLSEVAELQSGYPFRNRVEPVAEGGCRLVQMKDVDGLGGLREDKFARIKPPSNFQSHVLKYGDVLMAGRGSSNPAVTFLAKSGDTIAASNLFVLRPRRSALPDYLAWFLNLPATQSRLGALRAGSSVPFVRLNELRELEVPVPDLELQKRIVEIYKLSLQEEELLARIQTRRRTLVDAMLHDAVCRETSRSHEAAKPN